jgi:hypothetical protein
MVNPVGRSSPAIRLWTAPVLYGQVIDMMTGKHSEGLYH